MVRVSYKYTPPADRVPSYTRQRSGRRLQVFSVRNIRFQGTNRNGENADFSQVSVKDFMKGSNLPYLKLEHAQTVGTIESISFEPIENDGAMMSFDFSFTDPISQERWVQHRLNGFSYQIGFRQRSYGSDGVIYYSGPGKLEELTLTEFPAYPAAVSRASRASKKKTPSLERSLYELIVEN